MRREGRGLRSARFFAAAPLLVCLATSSARAVDGVIEINQASALAGGITPCDGPGFPVSICTPGAYRLTSNLDYPSASTAGILASVGGVSIDLNGMAVKGGNVCTTGPNGWVTSCSEPGSALAAIWLQSNSAVSNGLVQGSSGMGVIVDKDSEVRGVRVLDCGQIGVSAGEGSLLRDVEARRTNGYGVSANAQSRLSNVLASSNRLSGIVVGDASIAEGLVSRMNSSIGIVLGVGSSLTRFSAVANASSGVQVDHGSLVESGVLRGNSVTATGACALQGGGGASFRSVVITSAAGGASAMACGMVNLGGNACQGVACP